ncbi:glycosyltransferase [Paenibacillus sp. IB182496]|uniref:Glycosyltransferase n=1 Tax=Paenibacillus sabuli TaxID=2772509 RepID=A0A927C0F3_9BACL|nr:glycosyltransferase family 2 protein [Paenibacillus sabuli]MBD2848618.1 glycosyltransferase [Paenibacillus sabuli]
MRRLRRSQSRPKLDAVRQAGRRQGREAGLQEGYARGLQEGAGAFGRPFEGTSIVIPTYNKVDYLKECVASIQRYTTEPYELIIVDNASEDGTADYLRGLRGVRCRINAENLGFAGSVNQGLMMARGTTLLILNNDIVVTPRWLTNMLHCLHATHGIVGPVTNYISGEQQIETGYQGMEEMQQFAERYNHSDPSQWVRTERLMGFCLLMRRDDFLRIGYFDEGYVIGNCEDDDYMIRARLHGIGLVNARDCFIHHYGSVSMKSLEGRFDEVYGRNLAFFSHKWSDPSGMLGLQWQQPGERSHTTDAAPTAVLVRGLHPQPYWIEHGVRRPVTGVCETSGVRVSQHDLRAWPRGEPITADEMRQRQERLGRTSELSAEEHGVLLCTPEGAVFQAKSGRMHRFLNDAAIAAWGLEHRTQLPIASPPGLEGVPLLQPPQIKAGNL